MREIKFRAWDKLTKKMSDAFVLLGEFTLMGAVHAWQNEEAVFAGLKWDMTDKHDSLIRLDDLEVMQFTGLKDKNGKEIYEGDIFRIEEDGDEPNRIFYVVIVWVQEWCMFCSLLVDGEYSAYVNNGIEGLDEPMFWTYTLEDTNSRKHFLCGNIYEHPHLLKA